MQPWTLWLLVVAGFLGIGGSIYMYALVMWDKTQEKDDKQHVRTLLIGTGCLVASILLVIIPLKFLYPNLL